MSGNFGSESNLSGEPGSRCIFPLFHASPLNDVSLIIAKFSCFEAWCSCCLFKSNLSPRFCHVQQPR
ncbi:hypothetical protein AHF37_12783 [Paragonimus kellicotti]|nr:hypothetical protein AHF37_12783 [Paragonimus kellicotti]